MCLGITANGVRKILISFLDAFPAFFNFGGSQKLGDQYIADPGASKVGGTGLPVPINGTWLRYGDMLSGA